MPPSCKLTTCHVTETAGIKVFFPKKIWALSREQTVELRIVPENQDRSQSDHSLTKLASGFPRNFKNEIPQLPPTTSENTPMTISDMTNIVLQNF